MIYLGGYYFFLSYLIIKSSYYKQQMASNFENDALVNNTHLSQTIILIVHTTLAIS